MIAGGGGGKEEVVAVAKLGRFIEGGGSVGVDAPVGGGGGSAFGTNAVFCFNKCASAADGRGSFICANPGGGGGALDANPGGVPFAAGGGGGSFRGGEWWFFDFPLPFPFPFPFFNGLLDPLASSFKLLSFCF